MAKHGRSFWVLKALDQEIDVRVSWWYVDTEGEVRVAVQGVDWQENRTGKLTIERTAIGREIMYAVVESLLGDVKPQDRTVKGAAEQYASEAAKAIVEQRRRAALVRGAARLSQGKAFTVTLTREEMENAADVLVGRGPVGSQLARETAAKLMQALGVTRETAEFVTSA